MGHNILVTGANGFVGSALCRELMAHGHALRRVVRRADDPSHLSPLPEGEGIANLTFQEGEAVVVPVGDINPDTDWSDALDQADCVVHLAARVHVMKDTAGDPLAEFRRTNTAATEHLARCAAQAGVRRLVFMSSIKVNGEETMNAPFTESDPACPGDPYGVSKWEAELALARVAADTGLEIVILRPPLIYGPGVKGNFLALLKAVARGVPLPLASVNNHRSLLYLGNAVDALALAMTHPAAAGRTFLLSDGQDVSTPELIRWLAVEMDVPGRLLHCPPFLLRLAGRMLGKADSVSRLADSLQVDSSAIRRELGWAPPYSLEQGLRATAQWYLGA
ncbi:MAG: SDR family oxidoreductase [Gammaproteobacteria bacterium]|nr:SDR family oxidoreductase [Gammaproteobacteria bacterium]